jgi:hypothetical protein
MSNLVVTGGSEACLFAAYESLETGAKSAGQASFNVGVYVRGNMKYFELSTIHLQE